MGIKSLWFLFSILLLTSLCHGNDETVLEVVGHGDCADCAESNIKSSQAFSGLYVTIDCKTQDGVFKRRGEGKLDNEGKFIVSLPQEIYENGKLKEECFAQLQSATHTPCPNHNGIDSSKLIFKTKANAKHIFTISQKLKFSPITCVSASFLPPIKSFPKWKKKHFPFYKKPCPPLAPFFKKPLPPPVPVYKPTPKPPVPVYKPTPKPPVPIYKPPVYKPKPKPPVYKPKPKPPVYKPKPKPPIVKPPYVKPLPPPVPIYKKPLPPPVPIYKKPLPPAIPIYKPLPPPVPIYKKPLPPPIPIYKKPFPPAIPIYKPLPPIYKKPFPPIYKKPFPPAIPIYKPLPPLFKKPFPPFFTIPKKPLLPFPKQLPPVYKPYPKIPPKYFNHPIYAPWPPHST